MYCQQCSVQNPDSAKFCRVCGVSMRQIQLPTTNYSSMAHQGERQQQFSSLSLKPLGTALMSLGLAILGLFAIFVLLTRSLGLLELITILVISSIPISLGLLLRHLSRAGDKRNRILPSGKDTAKLSEHLGSESLSPSSSLATPVSSVTESTTGLLDAKREGRLG